MCMCVYVHECVCVWVCLRAHAIAPIHKLRRNMQSICTSRTICNGHSKLSTIQSVVRHRWFKSHTRKFESLSCRVAVYFSFIPHITIAVAEIIIFIIRHTYRYTIMSSRFFSSSRSCLHNAQSFHIHSYQNNWNSVTYSKKTPLWPHTIDLPGLVCILGLQNRNTFFSLFSFECACGTGQATK